jgi:DNA-binding NtrC family response regulator
MVDDDHTQLELYEAVFEPYHTVLLADNVKQAIDILGEQYVDAVGCDLHIGTGKGMDVLDWIGRNKPELMKKSVLISGDVLTHLGDLEVPLLLKPVQTSELLETFNQFLGEENRVG